MFHRIYTEFMLDIASIDAIALERCLHVLRLLNLQERYSIRRARQSMFEGLRRLWAEAGRTGLTAGDISKRTSSTVVAAIPWKPNGMNELIPTLIGGDEIRFSAKAEDLADANIFFGFGYGKSAGNQAVADAARAVGKPVVRMEYGFISSLDLAIKGSTQHSVILCPEVMYYDARNESYMERDLNDPDFSLTANERARADRLMDSIIRNRLTKYNHAPVMPLEQLIPESNRKKILLVDQRFGDASIAMGLASQDSFKLMWQEALKYKDHDIIVKLHPDAISGGKESCLSKVLPKTLPANVYILTDEINPISVLESVDKVFVCVSQLGFEALMLGKSVHCFGVSFYTGWGLTTDYAVPVRPRRKRSLQEIFHIFYVEYSRYALASGKRCELEELIDYLASEKKASGVLPSAVDTRPRLDAKPMINNLKILMVIPSGRFGATGRYFQVLALQMQKLGARVIVLAEAYEDKIYEGISWLKLEFEGFRLSKQLREKIVEFSPDIVYENGVRTRAQRAALEILYLTKAKLALQSEDDDIQVYEARHPNPNMDLICALDKPHLSHNDIIKFLKLNDWTHTFKMIVNPDFDRWVDPLLRALCYHCSSLNTAIWYPFARRLEKEYGAPTLVVPPVADIRELHPERIKTYSDGVLENVKEGNLVLFLGGTIYDYSPEFEIFLKAINILCELNNDYNVSLVVVSGRTKLNVAGLAKDALDPRIQFVDLGSPDDKVYMRYLVMADVICSPGLPDRFNLYRLPSRLVKAMLLGKVVLTTKIGFGESLHHGVDAVLIDGEDPYAWAQAMSIVFSEETLRKIGEQGREFARKNFDAQQVAQQLLSGFSKIL